MISLMLTDDDLVGPPTGPFVGPPIPGERFGTVPSITPDEKPAKIDPKMEAKARALDRAIQNVGRGWGSSGCYGGQ